MLQAQIIAPDKLQYQTGVGVKSSPTRYDGEYWDRIASDLFCGIADPIQDVGIMMIAQSWDADIKTVSNATDRWVPLTANDRANKSVWSLSEKAGLIFVPYSREAVENVMSWTMPYLRDGKVTEGSLSVAFPGLRQFRKHFDSEAWPVDGEKLSNFIAENCLKQAFFTMRWSWTVWNLYPGSIEVDQLLKLADPVVARINTCVTD